VAVVPLLVRDYNAHAISVVNGAGFVPAGWTVGTLGRKGTSGGITTQTVVNRVLGGLRPGEIVLMHCGSNPDDQFLSGRGRPARDDPVPAGARQPPLEPFFTNS
jgi:hypothetical protein